MDLAFLPDPAFMGRALELAKEAAAQGEIPVGAVVERGGRILGEGRNRRESAQSALAHGEMEAIHQACRALGSWRLTGCRLYVTLEPCPMCLGAAINARIQRIIFGAQREEAFALPGAPEVYRGFREAECQALLRGFFEDMRGRRG